MAVVHYPAVGRPERPVVSVCIANYNGERLLADCLASVLAQEGGHEVEIIVHDDASTDDSVAWLRQHYPQVELLSSEENVGFCIGNNRMVAHARGDFVLLLNNDAALFPDAVASLVAAAHAQAEPGILTLPQYDWESGDLVDRGCLLDPFYNPVPNLDPARRDVAYVIGACLWCPRVLWNELGGFPEWIESIGEDMYLCCVARLRGRTVQAATGSGYRHRQGASFGGNRVDAGRLMSTYRRRRLSERNKTAVLVVCTPTPLMWLLLAMHLCALVVEGIAIAALKRDRRIWDEVYGPTVESVFLGMARLRSWRGVLQAQRRVTLGRYLRPFVALPHKLRMLFRHGLPTVE